MGAPFLGRKTPTTGQGAGVAPPDLLQGMVGGCARPRIVCPFISSGMTMERLFDIMLRKPQPPPKQKARTPLESIFLSISWPNGPSITFHTCSREVQRKGRSRAWMGGSDIARPALLPIA